jgi:lipopolysaccharide exporter
MQQVSNELVGRRFAVRAGGMTIGSACAHASWIVAIVVAAKLVPVEELGLYYVFVSIGTVLAVAAPLGYHTVIAHISMDDYAVIVRSAPVVLMGFAVGISAAALLLGYQYAVALGLFIWAGGANTFAQMAAVRGNHLRILVVCKVLVPVSFIGLLVTSTLVAGSGAAAGTLIYSHVVASTMVAMGFYGLMLARVQVASVRVKLVASTLWRLRVNPGYVMPAALLNSLAYHLPTLLLQQYFGAYWAANYGMALRMCQVPIALVADTLSKMLHSEVAASIRRHDGAWIALVRSMRRALYLLAGVVGVLIVALSPIAFRVLLGDGWTTAAAIAQIFAPMFALMMIVSPLSVLYYVLEKQRELLIQQLLYMAIVILAFGGGAIVGSPWLGLVAFSALGCARYISLLVQLNGFVSRAAPPRFTTETAAAAAAS